MIAHGYYKASSFCIDISSFSKIWCKYNSQTVKKQVVVLILEMGYEVLIKLRYSEFKPLNWQYKSAKIVV